MLCLVLGEGLTTQMPRTRRSERKVATTSMEVRNTDLFRWAILPVLRRARPASSSKTQARNHATMENRKFQLCVWPLVV